MIPLIANIRKAIYCLNKRIDLLEKNGISGGSSGEGASSSEVAEIRGKVEALESIISEGDNPTAAIDKFNEIVAFLESIQNTDTLSGLLADIATLIPTNVSELLNDAGYLTQHLDISGKSDKLSMNGENAAVEDNIMSISSNGNPKDSGISVNNIALKTGYYKNLHAGLADNLFGSTQTNDVFTFRPTAGIQDIESGDAPVGGGTIKKVEGNTVAWNQMINRLNDTGEVEVLGIKRTKEGNAIHISGTSTSSTNFTVAYLDGLQQGHKIYVALKGLPSSFHTNFDPTPGNAEKIMPSETYASLGVYLQAGDTIDAKIYSMCIDLTLIYGAGNEPTTPEEFEADYLRWFGKPLTYEEYNKGELIPVKDFKVKSVGFNQWDEEWEGNSSINNATGKEQEDSGVFRSKNTIPVIGGESYYVKGRVAVYGYRSDGSYYGVYYAENDWRTTSGNWIQNRAISIPDEVLCIQIVVIGSTYNHDICISLSDDNRNGDYEEHWEREVSVDVTKVYGKLNGAGESVVIFPDGLKKTGDVQDEIFVEGGVIKAIKRVGSVDLGTLTYTRGEDGYISGKYNFYTRNAGMKVNANITTNNIICSKYSQSQRKLLGNNDKSISLGEPDYICVHDDSYTDPSVFKTAMNGVMLNYELATPQTYTDLIYRDNGVDTPVSELKYRVDNYGTEQVLLDNDEEIVSCNPTMTIRYGINAADTIADLQNNYVSTNPLNLTSSLKLLIKLNLELSYNDLKDKPTIPQIWRGTQAEYDLISTPDDNTIYIITPDLP